MKSRTLTLAALVVVATVAFLLGTVYRDGSAPEATPGERQVQHYICPMHPQYTSDHAGECPACGMRMVPVFAGERGAAAGTDRPLPAGTVWVGAGKQQLAGVRTGVVERRASSRVLRTVGRVATDDTRIFRINMAASGWIRRAFANSVGTLVRKNEPLATFYTREFQTAQQGYFYALDALDRFVKTGASEQQLVSTRAQVQAASDTLEALGMSPIQIAELAKSRKVSLEVELRSPAAGFVLDRNVSPGERFESGDQLYVIADLRRVWVLADVFENEGRHIRAGTTVPVFYQGQRRNALVSRVLPIFDANTRTLKVRLEIDNEDYLLRPDMFVDVEFPVQLPETLIVPVDAVLDAGLRKTVFVERGEGLFEPRAVKTGWRFDDEVEIVDGLEAGDRIAVSGTFLIDSESRIEAAAAGFSTLPAVDPVCGMEVDPVKARAAGRAAEHGGATYYFCSDDCRTTFLAAPAKYLEGPGRTSSGR